MSKKALAVLFLLLMFWPSTAKASEQLFHAEYLKAQKAYIEAVNRRADKAEIARLAEAMQKARNQLNENIEPSKSVNFQSASINPSLSSESLVTDDNADRKEKKSPFRFFTGLKDKIVFAFNQLRELFPKISRLQAFFVQRKLKNDKFAELGDLAAKNQHLGWNRNDSIDKVVNAHYTNTYSELKQALKSNCNWFECDVRLEGPLRSLIPIFGGEPRPVTAHDPFQTNGLLFDDWVGIVARSGRGIKVDLKTDNALDGTLATLKKHRIEDQKLIMNINVPSEGPEAAGDERIKKIRRDFPGCFIKLSPGSGSSKNGKYTEEAIDRMIEYSKACGQPVLYALRAEWVTPEIVKRLEPHGKVSIWNTTWSFNPRSIKAEVEKFRSWGVSGIVDLMSTLDHSFNH